MDPERAGRGRMRNRKKFKTRTNAIVKIAQLIFLRRYCCRFTATPGYNLAKASPESEARRITLRKVSLVLLCYCTGSITVKEVGSANSLSADPDPPLKRSVGQAWVGS
jgi:hypothetical protein